jgi:hypothetical protein
LQVHLACCACCRVAFEEYRHLADNVMPVVAAIASSDAESKPGTSSYSLDTAEQRLMSHWSHYPTGPKSHHPAKTSWQIPAGILLFGRGGPHRFQFGPLRATLSEEITTGWQEAQKLQQA